MDRVSAAQKQAKENYLSLFGSDLPASCLHEISCGVKGKGGRREEAEISSFNSTPEERVVTLRLKHCG